MSTKATAAQQKFVGVSSRNARRARTLLGQMADLERAERIKALREERHFTQPAVADEVGVTLRAYQAWEATGALKWDNAKKLAEFFGVDPHTLWAGDERAAATPALLQVMDGGRDALEQRLAAIEERQDEILQRLDDLAELWATAVDEAADGDTPASETRSARARRPRKPGEASQGR